MPAFNRTNKTLGNYTASKNTFRIHICQVKLKFEAREDEKLKAAWETKETALLWEQFYDSLSA